MKVFFKRLDVNKFTSKVTFEHGSTANKGDIINEMEAIAVLLGAYQKYGRKLGMNKYDELRLKFEELLGEVNRGIH